MFGQNIFGSNMFNQNTNQNTNQNQIANGQTGLGQLNQQPGSLFGNPSNVQPTTNLSWQSQNVAPSTSGSIFGGNKPFQAGTTTGGTSLFSSSQSNVGHQQGLFGMSQGNRTPSFMNPNQGQTGFNVTQPQTTGNLFGNVVTNQQMAPNQGSFLSNFNQNQVLTPGQGQGFNTQSGFGLNQGGMMMQGTSFGQTSQGSGQGLTQQGGLFGNKGFGQSGSNLGIGQSGFVGQNTSQPYGMIQQQYGTYSVSYSPTTMTENAISGGHNKIETIHFISITQMEPFKNKSLEELRYEDFNNKKKGIVTQKMNVPLQTQTAIPLGPAQPTQPTGGSLFSNFGGTNTTSQPVLSGLGNQPSSGGQSLFGGTSGNQMKGNMFGNNSQIFGQGQIQSQQIGVPTTQQPQTGLFQSSTSTLGGLGGMNKPNQSTSLFGSTNTTSQTLFSGTGQGIQSSSKPFTSPLKPQTLPQSQNFGLGLGQNTLGGLGLGQNTTGGLGLGQGIGQNLGGGGFSSSGFGQTQNISQGLGTQSQGGLGQTQSGQSIFGGTKTNTSSLLGGTTTGGQTSTGLFGGGGGGLFGNTTQSQFSQNSNVQQTKPSTGLFGNAPPTSTLGTTPSLFKSEPVSNQGSFTQSICNCGNPQLGYGHSPYSHQQEIFNNFLLGRSQKNIKEVLEDLQRQYSQQDLNFFDNSTLINTRPVSNDNLFHPFNYDHRHINRYDNNYLDSFLKSKRTFINPPKVIHERKLEEPVKTYQRPKEAEYKAELVPRQFGDEIKLGKKSHSCDLIKKSEKIAVNNLEKSFVTNLNLMDEASRKKRIENVKIDLIISLQDPIKISLFKKSNRTCKLIDLKSAIVEELRDKYPRDFKKLNENKFVLMKKYSILKDNLTLQDNDLRDGDTIYIILKESFLDQADLSKRKEDESKRSARKESIKSEKKKNKKNELAPLERLPKLTKQGYKTIPEMTKIYRMTNEELENVSNFTVYNEIGNVVFSGITDLSDLNLDQIITIEQPNTGVQCVKLYQSGECKPTVGKGLNKPATVFLNVVPTEEQDEDEFIAYLQKACNEIDADFKAYDKEKKQVVYKVSHF